MIRYCDDGELGYRRSRTAFVEGQGLVLDEAYRLAHLPLVAPDSPKAIAHRPDAYYEMGRHPHVYSIVLPVPGAALRQSPGYGALEAEIKAQPFAHKVAWHILEPRQDRLHATLCGSRCFGTLPPCLTADQRRDLARLGPLSVELRGLFSGNVNLGRLYLRAYPERRGDLNVACEMQRILGAPETDLYVVGLYNLTDDLDAVEAAALARLIERWWSEVVLTMRIEALWAVSAGDDLVLDWEVAETISLTSFEG